MKESDFLYMLIKIAAFLTPTAYLIWKAAMQSAKIKELEHNQITIRNELKELKELTSSDIKEIKSTLNNLSLSFVEIKTCLTFIQKAMEDKNDCTTNKS